MDFDIVGEITGAETFTQGSGTPYGLIAMATHTFVICTKNTGYEVSLETRKLYETLADRDAAAHGQLRVIDESGEDYLYPKSLFTQVDLPQKIIQQVFHAA